MARRFPSVFAASARAFAVAFAAAGTLCGPTAQAAPPPANAYGVDVATIAAPVQTSTPLPNGGSFASRAGMGGAGGAQDFETIRQVASSFLAQQTEGMPGRVDIAIAPAAPRGLAACPALEPFVPPGVKLWGQSMVGVRCVGDHPWTIYLQARITVTGQYYVAARTLNPGETIGEQDLATREGDLTSLPNAIVTNPAQAIGASVTGSLMAGMPIRSDLIRSALAVRFGQPVKLIARGNGFAVSSEGSALANASAGQTVRVKTPSGVVVSGIARADSSVEVPL